MPFWPHSLKNNFPSKNYSNNGHKLHVRHVDRLRAIFLVNFFNTYGGLMRFLMHRSRYFLSEGVQIDNVFLLFFF